MNRHEGQGSNDKCCEERAESGSLREYSLLPGNTLLCDLIFERSEDKDPNFKTILIVVILQNCTNYGCSNGLIELVNML